MNGILCHSRVRDCVVIVKEILFLHVMPDLIRHPGAYEAENILDSAKASLRARVKPGMTKNLGDLFF